MSHVGCRLMVASSANTSRPLAPAACGDMARALATKAAMSSEADGVDFGSDPALPAPACRAGEPSDFGLVGSPDISAHRLPQALCGARSGGGQCADRYKGMMVKSPPIWRSGGLKACSMAAGRR